MQEELPQPRKRGRPKVAESERLGHVLQLRLNDTQRTYLLLLAEDWGCSLGEAVRRCIERALDADGRATGMIVNDEPASLRQVLALVKHGDPALIQRLSAVDRD